MINQNPLQLRNSLTNAEFELSLYKLSIKELNSKLEDFFSYGMEDDCEIIQKVLNDKINSIVTTIEHD